MHPEARIGHIFLLGNGKLPRLRFWFQQNLRDRARWIQLVVVSTYNLWKNSTGLLILPWYQSLGGQLVTSYGDSADMQPDFIILGAPNDGVDYSFADTAHRNAHRLGIFCIKIQWIAHCIRERRLIPWWDYWIGKPSNAPLRMDRYEDMKIAAMERQYSQPHSTYAIPHIAVKCARLVSRGL